uniref:Protein rolling stone-like n=1 Tax=Phallusia mammillata TaxID=59560 RepID=A0A6F9DL90_9ASCI|nr:protein rolling stone-like [Phallusia mammillata]
MACCFNIFRWKECYHLNVKDFTSSQWGIPRWAFILYRTVVFLYWLAVLVVSIVQFKDVRNYFIYFSHLGQLLILMYFAAAFMCAVLSSPGDPDEQIKGKCQSEDTPKAKWYHWATLIFYTLSFGTTIIVSVGYPFLVATDPMEFASFQKHIVNILLMLLDMFLNRIPVNFWFIPFTFGWTVFYTVLTLCLHWTGVNSAVYAVADFVNSPTVSWLMAGGFVTICPLVMQLFMCLCYCMKMCLVKHCQAARRRDTERSDSFWKQDAKELVVLTKSLEPS